MTNAADGPSSETTTHRVRNTLLTIIIGLAFAALYIWLENFGYGLIFFWCGMSAAGIGWAGYIFWDKRSRLWFWPAIGALVVLHLLLIYSSQLWRPPPGSAQGLKGAVVLDMAACSAVLFWMHWLFDPHDRPRTRDDIIEEVAVYVAGIGVVGTLIWFYFYFGDYVNMQSSQMQVVLNTSSQVPNDRLLRCLAPQNHGEDPWQDVKWKRRTKRHYESAFDVSIVVVDEGARSFVRVSTLYGRPIPEPQRSIISKCLSPAFAESLTLDAAR